MVRAYGADDLSPVTAALQHHELPLSAEQGVQTGQSQWLVVGEDEPNATRARRSHDVSGFARLEGIALQAGAFGGTEPSHAGHPQ
jgi:hypothetical protein